MFQRQFLLGRVGDTETGAPYIAKRQCECIGRRAARSGEARRRANTYRRVGERDRIRLTHSNRTLWGGLEC